MADALDMVDIEDTVDVVDISEKVETEDTGRIDGGDDADCCEGIIFGLPIFGCELQTTWGVSHVNTDVPQFGLGWKQSNPHALLRTLRT